MGDWQIFLQISAPHSLMTTFWINLISGGSISLDSNFNSSICVLHVLLVQPTWEAKTFFEFSRKFYLMSPVILALFLTQAWSLKKQYI